MGALDLDYQHLDLQVDDEVLTVRLNRPDQLNAVNGDLHTDLARMVSALRENTSLGAIVVTGAGRAFCAGGDGVWFAGASRQDIDRLFTEARSLVLDMLEIGPPVIAAVNGPAVGLGATLALLCDMTIADERAIFSDPHVLMGVVAGDGGAAIWPALVGMSRAKQYLMTGDKLDAVEAERIGLINEVVPPGSALDAAHGLARRLADGPRKAIAGTKRSVNEVLRLNLLAAFETSLTLEYASMTSDEHREAVAAFADGRAPDFASVREE